MMDLKRFGCQDDPFFEAPDRRYVYFDDLRRRVQEKIIGSIGRISGAIVLTGEAGMGKTTMLHCLVEDIESRTECYLLSSMPWLTCRQGTTLRELADVFSYARCIARSGDGELKEHFGAGLTAPSRSGFARGPKGKRLAGAILDDAHHLAPEVLVQFRRWRKAFQSVRGPLSVILTTTSEEAVADAGGIADVSAGAGSKDVVIRLRPFNRNDVHRLIDHRLKAAGYAGPLLFSPEAVTRIFAHAEGNPSGTTRLCRRAVALAADDCGPISAAEIDAAAEIELMSQPNLRRNDVLRRTSGVTLTSMPPVPPAPGVPAQRVDDKLAAGEPSSGRSLPALRGRKAFRARLLDFASATTSVLVVLAVGWFYIVRQDAAITAFEATISAGVSAAIASVQPGADQRATNLPGEVASSVDAPAHAVVEGLPRKVETPRLRDLDQGVVTDMSAAGDQQPPSATGGQRVAVDPEPLEAPSPPPDAVALLSPDANPSVLPDSPFLVSGPEAPEAETAPAVEDLLDRGNRLLELGDVAAARLFYGMAAEGGSAEGALLMGLTFDPAYFERKGIHGTRPHVSKAAEWYQKAVALGSLTAEARKSALETRLRLAAQEGNEDARHALERLEASPR